MTAPMTSMLPVSDLAVVPTTCKNLILSFDISRRNSRSIPSALLAAAIAMFTEGISCGCTRSRIIGNDTFEEGANSKIRNVSSDQKCSSVETFQPKLPVWLSLCASARYASRRCSSWAKRSSSVTSIPVPTQLGESDHESSDRSLGPSGGSARLRKQRQLPSASRMRDSLHPASRFSNSSTSLSAFGLHPITDLRKTTRHDCPIFTIVQIWPKI